MAKKDDGKGCKVYKGVDFYHKGTLHQVGELYEQGKWWVWVKKADGKWSEKPIMMTKERILLAISENKVNLEDNMFRTKGEIRTPKGCSKRRLYDRRPFGRRWTTGGLQLLRGAGLPAQA